VTATRHRETLQLIQARMVDDRACRAGFLGDRSAFATVKAAAS
jgi:hypothetical protein